MNLMPLRERDTFTFSGYAESCLALSYHAVTQRWDIEGHSPSWMIEFLRITARNAIWPAQLADGLIALGIINKILDVDLHGWTPDRGRRMRWRQYIPPHIPRPRNPIRAPTVSRRTRGGGQRCRDACWRREWCGRATWIAIMVVIASSTLSGTLGVLPVHGAARTHVGAPGQHVARE